MRPIVRASVLWGVIGGLLFLVLALGYRLATGIVVDIFLTLAGAAFVSCVTAGLAYLVEGRFG